MRQLRLLVAASVIAAVGCANPDTPSQSGGGVDLKARQGDLAGAPLDGSGGGDDGAVGPGDDGGGAVDSAGGTSDATTVGDAAVGAVDATPPPDLGLPGKDPGLDCAADAECASHLCRPVVAQGSKVCVVPCAAQADCATYVNLFCEAIVAGGKDGYCVPRSPSHCASCATDADCGGLSERCLVGPGDIAPACHVDCALSGAAACPSDYDCAAVTDGGKQRMLCLPKSKVCLDAIGGYCDRVTLPQPCARTNVAGTCTGSRPCIMSSRRYDKCGAMAPQFKKTCADQDPAGCTLLLDPAATMTKQNCGSCGHACGGGEDCCGGACVNLGGSYQNCGACGKSCKPGQGCCGGGCVDITTAKDCGACGNTCPGYGLSNADAICANAGAKQCDLTCRGENYDVNGKPSDGCERLHATPPGHSEGTAAVRKTQSNCDYGNYTDSFTGALLSDSRVHANPSVMAFNGVVGSAPDYWAVPTSSHTFCQNDYAVQFTTSGGGNTPCYRCTIHTTKPLTNSVTVNGHGSATMSGGKSSYPDDSTVYLIVEKTCGKQVQEEVTYTITYHM